MKKIEGVTKVETDDDKHTATVTFDDKKTTLELIKEGLKKADFPTKGKAEYLDAPLN